MSKGMVGLLAVSVLLVSPPALAAEVKWQVEPGQVLIYSTTRSSWGAGRAFNLYTSQIRDGGEVQLAPFHVGEVFLGRLLSLPPVDFRNGRKGGGRYLSPPVPSKGPLQVEAAFKLTDAGGGEWAIEWKAQLTVVDARGKPTGATWQGTGEARIKADRGVIHRVAYTLEEVGGEKERFEDTLELKKTVALEDPAFAARIERAIQKGRKELKRRMKGAPFAKASRYPMGEGALAMLALLRSGVPADDPVIVAGFEALKQLPLVKTYSVALYLMALEGRHVRREEQVDQRGHTVLRHVKLAVPPDDLKEMARLTEWLLAARIQGRGVWAYEGNLDEGGTRGATGDHSNAQFAILALQAAKRSGLQIPDKVWHEIAEHFRRVQEGKGPRVDLELELEGAGSEGAGEKGGKGGGTRLRDPRGYQEEGRASARGWTYHTSRPAEADTAYASMTCAGLSSLFIARRWILEGGDVRGAARLDASLRDGLAWMQQELSVRNNPRKGGWPLYYLYSLEKVGELGEIRALGGRDWYLEGAHEIVTKQERDGGWGSDSSTGLALLFLARGTLSPRVEQGLGRTVTGSDEGVVIPGLGRLDPVQVIDGLGVGSTAEQRAALERARDVVEAMPVHRMGQLVEPLRRHLMSPYSAVRRFARDTITEITGAGWDDEEALAAWVARHEELQQAGVLQLQTALAGERGVLRQVAIARLVAMPAPEAVDDLLELLGVAEREEEAVVIQAIERLSRQSMQLKPGASTHEREQAITRFMGIWSGIRAARIAEGIVERSLAELAESPKNRFARKRIVDLGERALLPLIDRLESAQKLGHDGALLVDLLKEVSGADPGSKAEDWRRWYSGRG